jgi:hypothetical protein
VGEIIMKKVYRHGDVMIWAIDKLPKGIEPHRGSVLHSGDNNSHDIISGDAFIGESSGKKFLVCKSEVTLDHAEHGKGVLPEGIYEIRIKREYDHMLEESREVVD